MPMSQRSGKSGESVEQMRFICGCEARCEKIPWALLAVLRSGRASMEFMTRVSCGADDDDDDDEAVDSSVRCCVML